MSARPQKPEHHNHHTAPRPKAPKWDFSELTKPHVPDFVEPRRNALCLTGLLMEDWLLQPVWERSVEEGKRFELDGVIEEVSELVKKIPTARYVPVGSYAQYGGLIDYWPLSGSSFATMAAYYSKALTIPKEMLGLKEEEPDLTFPDVSNT
jgi:hypothetical protein